MSARVETVDHHLDVRRMLTTSSEETLSVGQQILCATIIGLLAVFVSTTSRSDAGGVTFVDVADSSTPIPGGTGNFSTFGLASINGNYIAFDATGSGGQDGIYVWNQATGLQRVTDTNGTGFSSFLSPTVDSNGTVAFYTSSGVYTGVGGGSSVTTVADTNSPVPGNPSGNFSFTALDSRPVSISNGTVAFEAFSHGGTGFSQGIYTGSASGGGLALVANQSSSLPYGNSTTQYSFLSGPVVNNGQLLFNATNGTGGPQSAVYAQINGTIVRVVDSTQTLPGFNFTYSPIESPYVTPGAISNGRVAFFTIDSSTHGGYFGMNQNGTLIDLATTNDMAPGGRPFLDVVGLGLNFGRFLPLHRSNSERRRNLLFASIRIRRLRPPHRRGDQLDGKTVSDVVTSPYSLSGDNFVVQVTFTDGSHGVFEGMLSTQAVPEPSSVALLTLGIGAVLGYRSKAPRVR